MKKLELKKEKPNISIIDLKSVKTISIRDNRRYNGKQDGKDTLFLALL